MKPRVDSPGSANSTSIKGYIQVRVVRCCIGESGVHVGEHQDVPLAHQGGPVADRLYSRLYRVKVAKPYRSLKTDEVKK